MSSSLKADGSVAPAWVEIDLGSDQTEVWVTFGMSFDSAALSAWTASGAGQEFLLLSEAAHSQIDQVTIDEVGWDGGYGFGNVPPPNGDSAFHLVELRHVNGGPVEFYYDSTLVYSGSDAGFPSGDTRFVQLGLIFEAPSFDPASIAYFESVKIGTTRGSDDLFSWPDTSTDLSAWTTTTGDVSVFEPAPPPIPSSRFYRGYLWRTIVTDLDSAPITCLERLSMNRTVTFGLNQPAVTAGQVPSDDPRVNIPVVETGLDAPSLSFNDRLVYMFRRENPGTAEPWRVRFAGICSQIEDTAQADQPYSNFTAYDPWQYLYSRAVKNGTSLVGPDGISWDDTRGDVIVREILENTIGVDGPCFIELADDWDETAQIDINFAQGTSVGDALKQLTLQGAAQTMDIIFTPVYDPVNKPGICATVHVYTQAGTVRDDAVMSWGVGRQVAAISDLLDGSQMANDVQYYNGQGGAPVTQQDDATSQARYGVYTTTQWFPAKTGAAGVAYVEAIAALQLDLRKQGRRSVNLSPASLVAPIPLKDYGLGDKVPVYATDRLRQPIPWASDATIYQRVYGIPIVLSNDGVETVQRLVASPDGFT